MTDVEDIVSEIDRLEPLPPIAGQILALAEDPDTAATEIADLIVNDPGMTANLLKTCNSAYFGLNRKVDSVREAIGYIGLDYIVQLVMLNSVSKNFSKPSGGYGLGEGQLWRHSVAAAHIAKSLAEQFGFNSSRHLLYTAALIKDIGKLILGRFVAFSYEEINILVHSRGFSFNDAEKHIIGMSHEELGAIVGQRWKFSDKLVSIIRHHHLSDEDAREDGETALVYLADIVCMMMGIGTGADGLCYRFYGDVLKRMGLSDKDLQVIIAEAGCRQHQIEGLIQLVQ
jgi:putative nucleotidyltransferase with HDIG domain